MNPSFAEGVDPVFLHVLSVLDQIRNNQVGSPQAVRDGVKAVIREADARMGQRQGWDLARYALAAWVDDVFIVRAPWTGREWWENNSLEFEFYKTQERATLFYQNAIRANDQPRRDALEVFYLCVVLGFRGLYGLPEATMLASHLNLPPTLQDWAQQTASSIQLGQGRPNIAQANEPAGVAEPLAGRGLFLDASLATVVLGGILSAMLYYLNS